MEDFVFTTTGNWFHLIIYPLQLPKTHHICLFKPLLEDGATGIIQLFHP